MKRTILLIQGFFASVLILMLVLHSPSMADSADPLLEGFRSPAQEYRPETWFHVIGYNMSREGLTKDLEAIKAAGIQGIHLFCRGGGDFPDVEQVIPLSPEGFALMRHVGSECERLALNLTLQNCGGWAMAGSPWVPVEEAQRELVQTVFHVKNGKFDNTLPLSKDLLKEDKNYQDVCVVAFPTPKGDDQPILVPDRIESNNKTVPWGKIFNPADHLSMDIKNFRGVSKKDEERTVKKIKGKDTYVQIGFERSVTIRSLRIPSTGVFASYSKIVTDVSLRIETVENGKRTEVAELKIPNGCWMDKQYDITLSVPEVTTKELRITFTGGGQPFVGHLYLQSNPRTHNWEAKAAFALRDLMQDNVLQYSQECYIDPETILDLTPDFSSGKLAWFPPKGDWTVIRFGHVNMGSVNSPSPKELQGWECSKLDKSALENHLHKGMIGQLNHPDGAVGDGKLKGLLADSWERMIPTWTMHKDDLFNEFQRSCGYDMRRFMPAMAGYVIQDQAATDKFLRDLRATMDDLYVHNFFAHFTKVSNDMGAKSYIEGATGEVLPGDTLRYYGAADVPMTEFWYRRTIPTNEMLNYKPVKYAASAAHIYNKERVAAEACTEGGSNWTEDFFYVKALIDQHFTLGVNHLVFHTFTHNPAEAFPGSTFGGTTGFPFVRNQTWWRHMPAFTDYLSRCQYILQQGEYVADVLWYLGDELQRPPFQMSAFPEGYQYDHLNPEVLQSAVSVQHGNLTIKNGGTYRVLWLRNSKRMLRSTAEKIKELVMAGAIVLGDKPMESPSLMDDERDIAALRAIADKLWGNTASGMKRVGSGKVYWGQSIDDVLKAEAVRPDLIAPKELKTFWHHRKTEDANIYFISSQNANAADATISFRITGKLPEIWNPLTGEQHPATVWNANNEQTDVAIPFDPYGSAIIVFRNPGPRSSITKIALENQTILSSAPGWVQQHAENHASPIQVASGQWVCWEPGAYTLTDSKGKSKRITSKADAQSLSDSWQVSFEKGWDTPKSITLDLLIPLSEHENKAIQYYSGTVTYRKTVSLSETRNTMLDLGKVGNIAEVWCNGKQVETRWAPPYQFDISKVAQNGENKLEVKITNTWHNQLVYDAGRPEGEKKTWTSNPAKNRKEPPRPYGLMGPVFMRSSSSSPIN